MPASSPHPATVPPHRMSPSFLKRPFPWWSLLVAWALLLWWLSSQPSAGHPPRIPHFDKVLHTSYFFLGGLFVQGILRTSGRPFSARQLLYIGLLVAAVIGALDEHHQIYTPGRSGHDPFDWMADVLGGLLAALLMNRLSTSRTPAP